MLCSDYSDAMNRLLPLIGSALLLCSSLIAPPLTASAQPGGPCTVISDDALSQALGSSVHALGLLSNEPISTEGTPTVTDMCIASLSQSNALIISHVAGIQTPGDISGMLDASQNNPTALLGGAAATSGMTATQLPGLGDTAVLLSGNSDGKDVAILVVWRGAEGYSLIGSGFGDPQTTLTGVAQAILDAHP